MDYEDLKNGQEFEEHGRRYIVIKNFSHFLKVSTPDDGEDTIIVFRPDDAGLTFRGGTMPEENTVLTCNLLTQKQLAKRNAF